MEAPKRGRAKIEKHYTTKDIYNYYKNRSKNPVSYKQYMNFLYGGFKKDNGLIRIFVEEIIYKSYILPLPCGGTLSVRKYKPKIRFKPNGDLDYDKSKIKVDWKATRTLWAENPEAKEAKTLCYFYNKHTRGYQYNYFWDKSKLGKIKNKYFYKYTPCRKLSRELAKVLKENPKIDYYSR